jgi:hypothetical protein
LQADSASTGCDAVEDEDGRDAVYEAISAALEVWASESLKRAQNGELAPV